MLGAKGMLLVLLALFSSIGDLEVLLHQPNIDAKFLVFFLFFFFFNGYVLRSVAYFAYFFTLLDIL